MKRNVFTAGRVVAHYPFSWLRAIRHARASGVKALLVTSNLTLWRVDTWAMRLMVRHGLAPVIIVHKPYPTIVNDPTGERAAHYSAFYQSAARILTMNAFTQELMQTLYQLPEERYSHFSHPHFQPLLDRFPTNRELACRLKEWAAGAPVVAFLSNARPEQGLDDLLATLNTLDAELADWRLLLVSTGGSNSHVKAVEGRLADLGFRGRCWYQWDTYSPSDLKAYLEAASLVVAPYKWATQSGVVALATGAGLPVVATKVGGLPEVILPGVIWRIGPGRESRPVGRGHHQSHRRP